jgi:hypothetical protein
MRFSGMPLNLIPFNALLGRSIEYDGQGNPLRVPFAPNKPAFFLPLDAAYDAAGLALQYLPADTVGDTPDDAKKRTELYEALRKDLQNALVRANERFGQERTGVSDLPRLMEIMITNGRAEETLKALSESELERDFKGRAALAAVLRVSLELALGRIEDANGSLASLGKPESAVAVEKAGLTPWVQLLRYQKAIHAGEYKAAGDLWNALAGQGIGEAAKIPPLGSAVPEPLILQTVAALGRKQTEQDARKALAALLAGVRPLPALPSLTRALTTELWLSDWYTVAALIRGGIAEQMQREANYFTRRGVLSLFEGDIPGAKRWLQQARRDPPPGWGLSPVDTETAFSHRKLIEMAEKRAVAP